MMYYQPYEKPLISRRTIIRITLIIVVIIVIVMIYNYFKTKIKNFINKVKNFDFF